MALLARWLHLLAAITWVGGMLFIALVFVPVTRRPPDPALRGRLVREAGRRFRSVGWIALGLLVLSGLANLWDRPYLLSWVARVNVAVVLAVVLLGLALRG